MASSVRGSGVRASARAAVSVTWLFLPEGVEGDDLGLLARGGRGGGLGRRLIGLGYDGGRRLRLGLLRGGELQQILHAGIVEAGDRGVGNRQTLGLAAELEGHREEGLAGRQVPVLVL